VSRPGQELPAEARDGRALPGVTTIPLVTPASPHTAPNYCVYFVRKYRTKYTQSLNLARTASWSAASDPFRVVG